MTAVRQAAGQAGWRLTIAFLAGALVGAFSAVEVIPNFTGSASQEAAGAVAGDGSLVAGGQAATGPSSDAVIGGPLAGAGDGGSSTSRAGGQARPGSELTCSVEGNGGSTDQGVTATQVRLATTVVEGGIGGPFLRDIRFAMEAVRNEVNRGGGICGRKLVIEYVDDNWDAQRGAAFLGNFINEPDPRKKIFAIPVGPSSEGLRVVVSRGDIDRAKIPVVGADGMLIEQYVRGNGSAQPWVWPVAAATVASARIMAKNAYQSGARTFGIVFDKNYRFGQEAARAYNAEVKRLTGNPVVGFNQQNNCRERFCGIQAGLNSYPNEVREFYRSPVDFTALFLEPQTALTWMADPNTAPASNRLYGAAQPLFTRDFAVQCRAKCDQMTVWTGFKPYIETYKSDPAVRKYVADLKRTNPQADEFNAFAVGGYVGMRLLADAMKAVGPNLTRERLKVALDTMTLDTGLTLQPKLKWRNDWRYVNTTMQGFVIQYKGTFGGWREGSIATDPHPSAGLG